MNLVTVRIANLVERPDEDPFILFRVETLDRGEAFDAIVAANGIQKTINDGGRHSDPGAIHRGHPFPLITFRIVALDGIEVRLAGRTSDTVETSVEDGHSGSMPCLQQLAS